MSHIVIKKDYGELREGERHYVIDIVQDPKDEHKILGVRIQAKGQFVPKDAEVWRWD